MNWPALDNTFGNIFCEDNGRPGKATRLMVALHYLEYTHDLSDEAVVSGWVENY
jgi:IS5 family transposase